MTVEELVVEARERRPDEPPPALSGVDNALRKLLRTLLSGFDYDARVESGPGVVCRALAAILAELEDLQRRH